jgi:protein-tyrosine-phosphatase
MGLFGRTKTKNKKKILFACIENSARSQMAEAFFQKYAPEDYEATSGGTDPRGALNPLAVEVMKEIGIDMSKQKGKAISEDMIRHCTTAINMGCMEKSNCPTTLYPKMIDWNIEDPKDKPIEKFREVRDKIEHKVMELVAQLEK